MLRQMLLSAGALCALLATAPEASAGATSAPASPVSLSGEVQVEREIVENGQSRRVLIAPDKVVPGERLVFTTRYRNGGAKPIQDFVVTNPLPAAVALADGGSDTYQVSVDGGLHWGALSAFTMSDGKGGKRPAEPADVTHLRWTIPLIAPGATGQVTYRATVR